MPAVISGVCRTREPEIGPRLENGKWRVLIGWRHTDDTAQGVKDGKIWAWVSSFPEKLQIFDEAYNRGEKEEIRFCGVANFTMVRMFHKFWCIKQSSGDGEKVLVPPQDGNLAHKRHCRQQYKKLIQKHRVRLDLPPEELWIEEDQQDNEIPHLQEQSAEQTDRNSQSEMNSLNNKGGQKRVILLGWIEPPQEASSDSHRIDEADSHGHLEEEHNMDITQQDTVGYNVGLQATPPLDFCSAGGNNMGNNGSDDQSARITDYFSQSNNNTHDHIISANSIRESGNGSNTSPNDVQQGNAVDYEHQKSTQLIAAPCISSTQDETQSSSLHDIFSIQDVSTEVIETANDFTKIKEEPDITRFVWLRDDTNFSDAIKEGGKMNPIKVD